MGLKKGLLLYMRAVHIVKHPEGKLVIRDIRLYK